MFQQQMFHQGFRQFHRGFRQFHFHHGFHHGFYPYRRPYRLFWFLVGASSTAFFMKTKECSEKSNRHWGHCYRAPVQVPQNFPTNQPQPPTPPQSSSQPQSQWGSGIKTQPWGFGQQDFDQQWEADRQKMIALGKQAQEAMADFSESTLDAIIATGESLKAKLAERKALREKQRQEEQTESQKKQPPPSRWV